MNQEDLTLAVAGVLFGAVVLGWILRWIFGHLNAGPRVSVAEYNALARRLADAEDEIADLRGRLAHPERDRGY